MDLTILKDFIDFGGTFILAFAFLYLVFKKLDNIEANSDKTLLLMMLMAKGLLGGNPLGNLLKKDKTEIKELLDKQ